MSNISLLVEESISREKHAAAFAVTRRLADLFPGKTVYFVDDYRFDFDRYVRYHQLEVTPVPHLHQFVELAWCGATNPLRIRALSFWVKVQFEGVTLDVVRVPTDYWSYEVVIGDSPAHVEKFFSTVCADCAKGDPSALVYQDQRWRTDTALDKAIEESNLDDMALEPSFLQNLREQTTGFFGARDTYDQFGIPWRRGLLLTGPPGNGKTRALRGIIRECQRPFVYVRGFDGEDSVDVAITRVFDRLRAVSPSILVLEDIDSLVPEDSLSAFLNEMDGAKPLRGVLTLATTNHVEKLDPALKDRPSRFDRILKFENPAAKVRRSYLRTMMKKWPPEMHVALTDITKVVRATDGYSFAMMQELITSGVMRWMIDRREGAMVEALLHSVESIRVRPKDSPEKPSKPKRRSRSRA